MISILCPSRGRPKLAKRMIDSAVSNAKSSIEIKLYLNNDDPTLDEYKDLIDKSCYEVGLDRSPAYSWNILAETAKYDYLFLAGDDIKFLTSNWDRLIIDEFSKFSDKIACVYPSHIGLKTSKNPHFCLHKNWISALGYFVPPHFWHWYVDTWTRELSKKIDRYCLLKNMVLDLELYPNDETTKRVHHFSLRERDRYLWQVSQRWLDTDAEALLNFIGKYK